VQSGLKLWPGFPFRRITSAWGIALGDHGVTLVCLGRSAADVRVLKAVHLLPPAWAQASDGLHDWLVQHLAEASAQEVRRHRRLVLALPMDRCQSGELDCPIALQPEAVQAEVQLEAAQSLNVDAQEVSFDFELHATSNPLMRRVHWLACLRSEAHAWHRHTRAAGWRLSAIEHQEQAARRAVQALRGGERSCLTQPQQDWQFHDAGEDGLVTNALPDDLGSSMRGTPAWAWLCACGAGLRALS
jgi:Tfp pilus assembly PilM family ATPase